MHRSATSMATRMLNMLGIDLGESLLEPAPENPTGFWEHEKVVSINDEILNRLNLSWHTASELPDDWQSREDIEDLARDAKNLIASEFSSSEYWAIKDPRLSRLAPFWRQALGGMDVNSRFIHINRHPLEVAESLRIRDAMGHRQSTLLWLIYNLEAERSSRGRRRIFLDSDALYIEPSASAKKMAHCIGIPTTIGGQLVKQFEAYVDQGLRHHRASALHWRKLPTEIRDLAVSVHDTLSALAQEDTESYRARLDQYSEKLAAHLRAQRERAIAARPNSVYVVVPVYRGRRETLRCLQSILTDKESKRTILVINDGSPDLDLLSDLQRMADRGDIELLHNDENRGFVHTVNKGLNHRPELDAVILNSDTVVPPGWLSRLKACAYSDASIGTVTPFSNNATLCSYPLVFSDNLMPKNWSVTAMDDCTRRGNAGRCIDIPTAVGFCTYLRRDCLNEIGVFDEANFGRGYGEENDLSMRASYRGWRNVLCADVFVFHEGGVSFGDSAADLMSNAEKQMVRLHPLYPDKVADFIAKDPAAFLRHNIDIERARSTNPADVYELINERYEEQAFWREYWLKELNAVRVESRSLDRATIELELLRSEQAKELVNTTEALRQAEQFVRQREDDIRNLGAETAQQAQQLENVTRELDGTKRRLQQVEKSRVWRLWSLIRQKIGRPAV